MAIITTAEDLVTRLNSTFGSHKPLVVIAGEDDRYGINSVYEDDGEIVIFLGKMP